jgi:cytochrome c peroxidase
VKSLKNTKRDIVLAVMAMIVLLVTGMGAMRPDKPELQLTKTYFDQLKLMQRQFMDLQESVSMRQPADTLRQQFIRARLTFKSVEAVTEYYFANFNNLLNPPAIRSAEEHQAPQGMQVIEEQLFNPEGPEDYRKLLGDLYKLNSAIYSLVGFERVFSVNELVPDALLEELYRIIALGVTGFDSPIAKQSIPESEVAIRSVRESLQMIGAVIAHNDPDGLQQAVALLEKAEAFCRQHPDFDSFDRMTLTRDYLNPVCAWLGMVKWEKGIKDQVRYSPKPHYPAVSRYFSLFDQRFVSTRFFSPDSTLSSPGVIALGHKLFADPILAGNNQRSCATCHDPAKGFTDGLPRSLTIDNKHTVTRNAPTLWNAALQRDLFHDHRQRFMENLVEEVLANTLEMNSSAAQVAEKVNTSDEYRGLVSGAFGNNQITAGQVNIAIASYVRSLISLNARFDQYMRGHNSAMNAEEILGYNVFMGKAKCGTCHFVPLFNGSKPPMYDIVESEVIGVPGNADSLKPVMDADRGRILISRNPIHENAFKTPTVRNIALTAPYMHNGVYKTLEEVVEFYNKGGGTGLGLPIDNQTLPFDKLDLTDREKKALIAFMHTLTDTSPLKTY